MAGWREKGRKTFTGVMYARVRDVRKCYNGIVTTGVSLYAQTLFGPPLLDESVSGCSQAATKEKPRIAAWPGRGIRGKHSAPMSLDAFARSGTQVHVRMRLRRDTRRPAPRSISYPLRSHLPLQENQRGHRVAWIVRLPLHFPGVSTILQSARFLR